MTQITRLAVRGYKSIRELEIRPLRKLNVLIGANGAGKSNLVSFFRMLIWMTNKPGDLQFYIGKSGGANSLLHDGAARTPQVEATLEIDTAQGLNEYSVRLFHAAPDTLIFADEKYRFSARDREEEARWVSLGSGHRESRLLDAADHGSKTAQVFLRLLASCKVYQFHNTSETARMKFRWDVEDGKYLKEDAANLAPFLYRMRESAPAYYRRIVDTIRQAAPFLGDFVLEVENGTVILQWREPGSDVVFSAHQASDGSLRWFALMALLLQPDDRLPNVLILDEPELGLHPYAIKLLAGAIQSASTERQVIVCTQSMSLINHFEPDDIIVVDRPERESTFRRLDPEKLGEWLANYSLAELWEKNVIGGRP